MNELVSIIVPIYKVELYLGECIQSLVNQTYNNLEIILVDDGSPDSCGNICDYWALMDPRIRVVHKSNGGLSDARNAGLDIAGGEYIAFVDSDDWVTVDYIQILYETMKKTGAQIVEGGIIRTEIRSMTVPTDKPAIVKPERFSAAEALSQLIQDGGFHQYVWNKLYHRIVIQEVPFAVGRLNEDEFWTYRVFGNADSIVRIEVPLYFYYQRPSSIMGSGYSFRRLDALDAKAERQHYIDQTYPELSTIAMQNLAMSCMYSGQMTLKYLEGDEYRGAVRKVTDIWKTVEWEIISCSRVPMGRRVWLTMARISLWHTCRFRNMLKRGF